MLLLLLAGTILGFGAIRWWQTGNFFDRPRLSEYAVAVCDAGYASFEKTTKSTAYIRYGDFRIDATFTEAGESVSKHIIYRKDEDVFYLWIDDVGARIKTRQSLGFIGGDEGPLSQSGRCHPWWWPDQSLFVPPGDVDFSYKLEDFLPTTQAPHTAPRDR